MASTCSASDAGLGLALDAINGIYFASTNAQLAKLCECTSIDYFRVSGCADCTQATLDACALETIRGADSALDSLTLNSAPLITSLSPGLGKLSGDLPGRIAVHNMDGLATLEGLEGVTGVTRISLVGNDNLWSAVALQEASYTADWQLAFEVAQNPDLACVPAAWPRMDKGQNMIRSTASCLTPATHFPTPSPAAIPMSPRKRTSVWFMIFGGAALFLILFRWFLAFLIRFMGITDSEAVNSMARTLHVKTVAVQIRPDTPPPCDTPAYHEHIQQQHGSLDPQRYIPGVTAQNNPGSKWFRAKVEKFVPEQLSPRARAIAFVPPGPPPEEEAKAPAWLLEQSKAAKADGD